MGSATEGTGQLTAATGGSKGTGGDTLPPAVQLELFKAFLAENGEHGLTCWMKYLVCTDAQVRKKRLTLAIEIEAVVLGMRRDA